MLGVPLTGAECVEDAHGLGQVRVAHRRVDQLACTCGGRRQSSWGVHVGRRRQSLQAALAVSSCLLSRLSNAAASPGTCAHPACPAPCRARCPVPPGRRSGRLRGFAGWGGGCLAALHKHATKLPQEQRGMAAAPLVTSSAAAMTRPAPRGSLVMKLYATDMTAPMIETQRDRSIFGT